MKIHHHFLYHGTRSPAGNTPPTGTTADAVAPWCMAALQRPFLALGSAFAFQQDLPWYSSRNHLSWYVFLTIQVSKIWFTCKFFEKSYITPVTYSKARKPMREIKKTTPWTTTLTKIKYLGIHLTEEVKDLFSENWKTLMKEIEDDTNKWKDIPCSWIRRIRIVKRIPHPKAI